MLTLQPIIHRKFKKDNFIINFTKKLLTHTNDIRKKMFLILTQFITYPSSKVLFKINNSLIKDFSQKHYLLSQQHFTKTRLICSPSNKSRILMNRKKPSQKSI